jgi:peptide/nickel transport system substrate-binding protein
MSAKLHRRNFLRLSAMGAASAAIVACGGNTGTADNTAAEPTKAEEAKLQPTTPPVATAIPVVQTTFKQSPSLDQDVADGKLPNVDERLPKAPYTPPHVWLTVGKYGGKLRKTYANTWGIAGFQHESMYGHSILRYLKDGLAIGPGLAESWEASPDATKWTFKFREGLKWSDGQPWTVGDIMYWWESMVGGNGKEATFPAGLKPVEGPPDEARSGKGTLVTINKVDDFTMEMVFDAPAPLTADRIAMWVNAGIGPRWHAPAHYMKQFNPVLTPETNKDWEMHSKMVDFKNPDLPRMSGWYLTTYEDGVRTVWQRNPYYWCVDAEGQQLPYIDTVEIAYVKDKESEKLAYLNGQVDHAHFHTQTLGDIKDFKDGVAKSNLNTMFWDSGSGTGSMYFFNFDYKDAKLRAAFRDPKFRQALSHAYDRADVQKAVYFGLGELSNGTMSPKAIEYNFNDEAKTRYAEWRDSYLKYDVATAEKILDDAGYKKGADGKRTLADGSPMQILVTYPADESANGESLQKNERLVKNWQAIGIDCVLTPIPNKEYDDKWRAGEIMMKTAWEVGDGPNHLVYPQWVVPIEGDRWAPVHGKGYDVRGTATETEEGDLDPWARKPARLQPTDKDFDPVIGKIYDIYDKTKVEPDVMKRHQMVWDMMKIHVESGPFFSGTITNQPRIILAHTELKNVPTRDDLAKEGLGGFVNPWIIPAPATYDPETWFWDDASKHS